MDGQNCNNICSRTHQPAVNLKKKKKKEIPDRVTLKKEIGLLSACTIIIGFCSGTQSGGCANRTGYLQPSQSTGRLL
uniref:Uncharacterized protein n=1 Tax=Cyprinodon variegatus TaxID=28743 RepID=A0A3Q2G601_CYPVA